MIEKSTINLNYANTYKKHTLVEFINEYARAINIIIKILWKHEIFKGVFADKVILDVVEYLKNVKHKTKGKNRKEFNNKLQRWVYRYFLVRLEQLCEVVGVQLLKLGPAYTTTPSQTCFACADVHRSNRNGELFKCRNCGYTTQHLSGDADYNTSLNILNRYRLQEHMVLV